MKNGRKIEIGHGSGGLLMHELIRDVFIKGFDNLHLRLEEDSAIVKASSDLIACTTDTYVVHPVIFPGGDLGKLAVCGTINDLAVSGATPQYLTAGFILEEGLPLDILEELVESMKTEADRACVKIIAGDTKVVGKGQVDQLFINTSGIGYFKDHGRMNNGPRRIDVGDVLIINGFTGEHEAAIINAREKLFDSSLLVSDCAALNDMIEKVLVSSSGVKFMRDITRGGLSGILNEISRLANVGMNIEEHSIPVSDPVKGFCEMLGYDPFYFACEGRCLMVCSKPEANDVLSVLRRHELGRNAAMIGEITKEHPGEVILNTLIGGRRIMEPPVTSQTPRIC